MATQNNNDIGTGVKFAPLTIEQPRRQERQEEPAKTANNLSSNTWIANTSSDQNKSKKFAPIQLS